MTNQQEAEGIAKFLGEEDRVNTILDNYPHQFFKKWLASDAGTVAMILKLRGNGLDLPSFSHWEVLVKSLKKRNINKALQAAILEVMENE